MSVRQVEKLIKRLQEDDTFLENWGSIQGTRFGKAKKQEHLLISNSDNLLIDFKINSNERLHDSYLDLCFGDFYDSENFYDLKVGENFIGSITKISLENFGRAANHYYLCVNNEFTKFKIINARELLSKVQESDYRKSKTTGKPFIGELDFENILAR